MKVTIGLSGGVDSAVAAYRLLSDGYDVSALFMKNWEDDDGDAECPAEKDYRDAKAVAARLQIPQKAVNFSKDYWDRVFEHFLAEYRAGRTPNPDILCNKEIKFKAFLDKAIADGADAIATGHYARVKKSGDAFQLLRGFDANKDQSYFLYTLNQYQLSRALFPIGEMEKPEVREIAKQNGFPNHAKKDSTGICFIGERKFKSFLQEYVLNSPGDVKTPRGEIIGKHDGLMFYTIGQRQGLQIGGLSEYPEGAWYVAKKDLTDNALIVVQDHDHPLLYAPGLVCQQLHWVAGEPPAEQFECTAKIRYRQADQHCMVKRTGDDTWHVVFANAQRAITPGQSIVFYQGVVCLGGGVIESVI